MCSADPDWDVWDCVQVPMDQVSDAPGSFHPPASLLQKLMPLALIFFCASFNLTILANLKDAIVRSCLPL